MKGKTRSASGKSHAPVIVLVCWNADEGRDRAAALLKSKLKVQLECDRHAGPAILLSVREAPPDAIVISLDRLPMQGRDLGVAIRTGKQTRNVPLVFAGGEPEKVERVRQMLPDAIYSSWPGVASAVQRSIRKPNLNPLVPGSNLAGYSGTPLPKKLGIKPNCSIALLDEPEKFVEVLGELPERVRLTNRITADVKLGIWFVRSMADLASRIDSVAAAVGGVAHLWICWTKRTSPLVSDVNEQAVRVAGLAAGLVDYKVAAIDTDWSGLLFAPRREEQPGAGRSRKPRR